MLVQRDEVAHLHLALLDHQLEYVKARDQKSSQLSELRSHRHSLEKELVAIAVSEYASQNQSFATGYAVEGGGPSGTTASFRRPAPTTAWASSQSSCSA